MCCCVCVDTCPVLVLFTLPLFQPVGATDFHPSFDEAVLDWALPAAEFFTAFTGLPISWCATSILCVLLTLLLLLFKAIPGWRKSVPVRFALFASMVCSLRGPK